jgi:hypothetical protein
MYKMKALKRPYFNPERPCLKSKGKRPASRIKRLSDLSQKFTADLSIPKTTKITYTKLSTHR